MNGVHPSLLPSARRSVASASGSMKGTRPPGRVGSAGRGRSSGRVSSSGAPASTCLQWSISRRSTSPESQLRCHTAKSAYWTGSSGRGEGEPAANAR